MIGGKQDYYWHEMTFFIHQPHKGDITVLCFEVPNDEPDPDAQLKPDITEHQTRPHNFLDELKAELNALPTDHNLDWRYMQSLLLRHAVVVVDRGVWACSKAVRKLEKVWRIVSIDFK